MRRAATWMVFPVLMALAIALAAALVSHGVSRVAVLGICNFVFLMVIWALEPHLTYRDAWLADDGELGNDMGHALFGTMLGGVVGNLIAQAFYAGFVLATGFRSASYWPSQLPFVVQLVAVILLADLGRWVQHWCLHRVPFLWRFHQLHHSGVRMSVWKTSRSHITERIGQQLFMYSILMLLGAPEPVLFWYVLPNTILGFFAHSNVDARLGPLEYVIMGPGAHRLHHSADLYDGNRNFGSSVVIWDILFGTYSNPMKRPEPVTMGIVDDDTPKGFIAQILQPFR